MKRILVFHFFLYFIISTCSLGVARADDCARLVLAAWSEDVVKINKLIGTGVNLNCKNRYGTTALMAAAQVGNVEITRLLLNKGADPNIKNNYGRSALILTGCEDLNITKTLLDHGANPNEKNIYGSTALMLMAGSKLDCIGSIKILLEYGADPSLKDDKGRTFLDYAAESNDLEVFFKSLKKKQQK